jgi:hypothetical protein
MERLAFPRKTDYFEHVMKLKAIMSVALFAAVFPFGAGSGSASAQLSEPLRLYIKTPLKDVFGRNLDGPSYVTKSRVDIFSVGLGKPSELVTNTVVGVNATPHQGLFSLNLIQDLEPGTRLRAVAYDAPTSEDASFFCSSSTVNVPETGGGRLLLNFSEPKPMAKFGNDEEAARLDAINRQFSPNEDFDGDGMSDYAEALVRTDIENQRSLLTFDHIGTTSSMPQVVSLGAADGDGDNGFDVVLRWQAAAGVTYHIQYAPSLLSEDGKENVEWEDIVSPFKCTADDLESSEDDPEIKFITREVRIANEDPFLHGHFRILVSVSQ